MSDLDQDPALAELGKQLPWDRPDDARREAVRSSLLVAATQPTPVARTRWSMVGGAFVAGVAAAAAVFAFVARPHETVAPAQLEAHLEAPSTTRFDRDVTRTARGTDEVVRLHDGSLQVAVAAAPAGSRFRVATRDAEIEGAGAYRIAVENDSIRSIIVDDGTATLRITGQQPIFLATGQSWKSPVLTASVDLAASPTPTPAPSPSPSPTPAPAPSPSPSPSPAPSPSASPSPTPTARPHHETPAAQVSASPSTSADTTAPTETGSGSGAAAAVAVTSLPTPPQPPTVTTPEPPKTAQIEQHFKTGWELLKSGKSAEAARELGIAADLSPDEPLATDARYFQATALIHAGRKTEAEKALVAYLDHAHQSLRRGRAAVTLARLIAERGDNAAARSWFESALTDADPAVVAAARQGLSQLH
jgi:TolA-binding protein